MTYYDYLKFLFAFIFVLSLMGGLAYVLKRLGFGQGGVNGIISPKKKRLQIIEAMPIDSKHKAILLQRDDTQHLVLLGTNSDTIIETNIKAPKEKNDTTKN